MTIHTKLIYFSKYVAFGKSVNGNKNHEGQNSQDAVDRNKLNLKSYTITLGPNLVITNLVKANVAEID